MTWFDKHYRLIMLTLLLAEIGLLVVIVVAGVPTLLTLIITRDSRVVVVTLRWGECSRCGSNGGTGDGARP